MTRPIHAQEPLRKRKSISDIAIIGRESNVSFAREMKGVMFAHELITPLVRVIAISERNTLVFGMYIFE